MQIETITISKDMPRTNISRQQVTSCTRKIQMTQKFGKKEKGELSVQIRALKCDITVIYFISRSSEYTMDGRLEVCVITISNHLHLLRTLEVIHATPPS